MSSRLGQNPNFYQIYVSVAPLTHRRNKKQSLEKNICNKYEYITILSVEIWFSECQRLSLVGSTN